jgi:hypothetical protein
MMNILGTLFKIVVKLLKIRMQSQKLRKSIYTGEWETTAVPKSAVIDVAHMTETSVSKTSEQIWNEDHLIQ